MSYHDPEGDDGWTSNRHPDNAWEAGRGTAARSQRDHIHRLLTAVPEGLNAHEIGERIGMVPNQVAARLIDLWQTNRAAVLRERGHCWFGVCPYETGRRHLAHEPCERHGDRVLRRTTGNRKGAVWVDTSGERVPAAPADPQPKLFEEAF